MIKINIFRPPTFNDQLTTLQHPLAVGVSEIVQTSDIYNTNSDWVLGFCFVFSEQDIIPDGVEVSGMKLAQMLQGRVIESGSGAESIYAPTFPSQCVGFNDFFTGRSDVALVLW